MYLNDRKHEKLMVGSRESKQNFTEILEEIIKIIMKRMKR